MNPNTSANFSGKFPAVAVTGLVLSALASVSASVWLTALAAPDDSAPGAVRILSPRLGEVVSGRSALEAEVSGLEGASLEFFVDGRSAGKVSQPPYRLWFDFGESLSSRRIRAVATTADGRSVLAEVATRALDVSRVDQIERVDLVNLYVTVRNRDGQLFSGLEQKDFSVYENNRSQQISHFSSERRPLVIALVIDSSLSMKQEGKIESAREAAVRLLSMLQPDDRAMVVSFNQEVRVLQEPTTDREALTAAIGRCEPKGGTALYDAIYRSAEKLGTFDGRKVIVLLSDGRDEADNGLEPGSLHTLEESLDRVLRTEVILYAVGVGKKLDSETDFYGKRTLSSILEQLGSATGGRGMILKRPSQVREAFEEIGEELRRQYSIAYSSSDARRDGGWRLLRVTVSRPGLSAVTRTGYYAPRG